MLPNGQIADCSTALKETLLAVKDVYEANRSHAGIACAMKNSGVGVGLPGAAGYLFMPGDQPLVRPASLRRLAEQFIRCPERAVRLGYKDIPGSPVLFPAFCREALLAYEGDRGGMEVIRQKQIPCDTVQAKDEWELWDVDTLEKMERVREVRSRLTKEE